MYKAHPYHKYASAGTIARTVGGAVASRYAPTATGAVLGAYNTKGGLSNKLTGAAIGAAGARYVAPVMTGQARSLASKVLYKSNPKARIRSMNSALNKAGVNASASKQISKHRGMATHNLRSGDLKGYAKNQKQYRSAMKKNMSLGQRANFAVRNPDTLKASVGLGLGGAALAATGTSKVTGAVTRSLGLNKKGSYEKEANLAVAKGLFTAGKGFLSAGAKAGSKFLSTQGNKGLDYARTYAPNALARGSLADKGIRGAGNMLKNPAFHLMGGLNAYNTDGSFMDKAKSYAIGGSMATVGWKSMSNAGRQLAGKSISNPAMLSKNLTSSMRNAGMDKTVAARAGVAQYRATKALKAGDFKAYDKLEKSRKALMDTGMKNMSFGQKLKFNFRNNPMYFKNKAIGAAGLGTAGYGTVKAESAFSSLAGVSPEQLARKNQQRQYEQMSKNMPGPMRNNTVMHGNNPYS